MGPAAIPLLVASTVYGVNEQRKAGKEDRKRLQAEQRIADAKARRDRVRVIREARIKRAQVEQSSVTTGTTGSSGEIGAVSSIASQAAGSLGFLDQVQDLSTQANIFAQRSVKHQTRAGISGAIGTIAGSTISPSDWENFSIFNSPKPKV